ncbi:MAG TPA: hypothetical protein VD793_11135 [Gemmatimonadales bacterium]|nr:hypothetical protein [Gemmatimonadales bacterium]
MRHTHWRTSLAGYSATIHTVLEGRIASHRFAPGLRIVGGETVARVVWLGPGIVQV